MFQSQSAKKSSAMSGIQLFVVKAQQPFVVLFVSSGFGVVLRHSYFWHQAQVCMSLARVSDDTVFKQRYEELALEFAQTAGDERDLNITTPSLSAINPKFL
jgi:hypothetical protein